MLRQELLPTRLQLPHIIVTYLSNNLDDEFKYYLGLAETNFKEKYGKHKSPLKNENNKYSADLLKYFWSVKENGKVTSVKWKIVKIVYSKTTLSS